MLRIVAPAVLAVAAAAAPAPAAVLVLANYTPAAVAVTVSGPGAEKREIKLSPYQVAPVDVGGPADVTFSAKSGPVAHRLDPAHAYAFVPDPKAGLRLDGIDMPGKPPAADGKPVPDFRPLEPVKIPVVLMVDDADPRADKLWQATLRKRLTDAAAVVVAHSGVRFEFAGFGTWKSDPDAPELVFLLEDLEKQSKPKPGQVVVGYTSRKFGDREAEMTEFGATRGAFGRHVLVREWKPKNEDERVEVLVHYLGSLLGAVNSPDPYSVMRPKLGDGKALSPRFVVRFDPLNTLAMSLTAEEWRRGTAKLPAAAPDNRQRLARVYGAISQETPDETRVAAYLRELDNEMARVPPDPVKPADPVKPPPDPVRPPVDPVKPPDRVAVAPAPKPKAVVPPDPKNDPPPKPPVPPIPTRSEIETATEAVLKAVVAHAREYPQRGTGDERTVGLMAAAAVAAERVPDHLKIPAFLLASGIALDSSESLRDDPRTAPFVRAVEPDAARAGRLAVLGVPTLRHRADLCRRFAAGVVTAELAGESGGADSAVARALDDLDRPAGLSFAAVAAEFAGVEFARRAKVLGNETIARVSRTPMRPAALLPPLDGLRAGLGRERFATDYGGPADARFRAALEAVQARASKTPPYWK